MSSDVPKIPAERDALARRVHRFIAGLERARRPTNRRESHHLVAALRFMQDGQYEAGQAAMTDAERLAPIPAGQASLIETNTPVPVQQLRAALQALLAGKA
jgi:hypothetical protein